MDPVLMIPKTVCGSRRCLGVEKEWFLASPRTIGTNDVSFCIWIRIFNRTGSQGVFRASGSGKGWGLYWVTAGNIRLYYGDGTNSLYTDTASASLLTLGEWNFFVVNLDRDGYGDVYLNDMSTPIIHVDISAHSAVDWLSGYNPWMLNTNGSAAAFDSCVAGAGHLIGSGILLDSDDRSELLNGGRMLRYADFSSGLATKFASQDYWELRERSGDGVNSVTSANVLVGRRAGDNYDYIGSSSPPVRAV